MPIRSILSLSLFFLLCLPACSNNATSLSNKDHELVKVSVDRLMESLINKDADNFLNNELLTYDILVSIANEAQKGQLTTTSVKKYQKRIKRKYQTLYNNEAYHWEFIKYKVGEISKMEGGNNSAVNVYLAKIRCKDARQTFYIHYHTTIVNGKAYADKIEVI